MLKTIDALQYVVENMEDYQKNKDTFIAKLKSFFEATIPQHSAFLFKVLELDPSQEGSYF
jgi:hypothetical protein